MGAPVRPQAYLPSSAHVISQLDATLLISATLLLFRYPSSRIPDRTLFDLAIRTGYGTFSVTCHSGPHIRGLSISPMPNKDFRNKLGPIKASVFVDS
ncbi:expressed protein [Echinococcus multilocularis]|uniref:Expressed protein n=1 Tax=Echinococcus multilocularis TaxID=6211 RepID=A0A068YID4_ECHMU|nr:expressed protein [Echinococcus multilocularis]